MNALYEILDKANAYMANCTIKVSINRKFYKDHFCDPLTLLMILMVQPALFNERRYTEGIFSIEQAATLEDFIKSSTLLVSEYLGQSEINVLQEAKPFVTMAFQN